MLHLPAQVGVVLARQSRTNCKEAEMAFAGSSVKHKDQVTYGEKLCQNNTLHVLVCS